MPAKEASSDGDSVRGGHPRIGEHSPRGRAVCPVRLRAGGGQAPPPPHPGAQDQRADLCRRPLAAHRGRGRRPTIPRSPATTTMWMPAVSIWSRTPARYDVIVTDNLFGDIITDLAGAIAGGIGYAASANLNPDRTGPSLFEPVHGAAHDIAGTGKANPAAAIRSAALMLDHLGEHFRRRQGEPGGRRIHRVQPRSDPLDLRNRRRNRRKALSHAHYPDRKDLDGRRAGRLGRRHRSRAHPHHALRLGRVRRHPRLPDTAGCGRLPPARPHRTTASCRPRCS